MSENLRKVETNVSETSLLYYFLIILIFPVGLILLECRRSGERRRLQELLRKRGLQIFKQSKYFFNVFLSNCHSRGYRETLNYLKHLKNLLELESIEKSETNFFSSRVWKFEVNFRTRNFFSVTAQSIFDNCQIPNFSIKRFTKLDTRDSFSNERLVYTERQKNYFHSNEFFKISIFETLDVFAKKELYFEPSNSVYN